MHYVLENKEYRFLYGNTKRIESCSDEALDCSANNYGVAGGVSPRTNISIIV